MIRNRFSRCLHLVRRGWRFPRYPGDSGNVALLVAFSMVALCGFAALVVDAGYLYLERQRAQAAADAGSLAGAEELLQGAQTAVQTAVAWAAQNDPSCRFEAAADPDSSAVAVTGAQSVPLWFGRVLGRARADVAVTSVARIGPLSSGIGMVPIAVPQQLFSYGQLVYLSAGAGDGSSGNYGFLDFSGNGARGLEEDIEHGYDFPLQVGEQVAVEPGVMSGPVAKAIQYRMDEAAAAGCTSFASAAPDCPRVLYMPVVDTLDVSGKKDVTIVGFAAFFLEGLDGSGGQQRIVGRQGAGQVADREDRHQGQQRRLAGQGAGGQGQDRRADEHAQGVA
ncbi:MAG: hypothetical protein K6T30_05790, partial [Alicyclobacillus sp.]|nr:hypothetical protein [Alicyclobacillus sp.]